VREVATASLHAAPILHEIGADLNSLLKLAGVLGVDVEAVLFCEILGEGLVLGFLFLASLCQTHLTLEEQFFPLLLRTCPAVSHLLVGRVAISLELFGVEESFSLELHHVS
jgi:hypothetical protein